METDQGSYKPTLAANAICEFEKILDRDPPATAESTDSIDESIRLAQHHTLQSIRDFVANHYVMFLLHKEYTGDPSQPSDVKEGDEHPSRIYEFVEKRLNNWIFGAKVPPTLEPQIQVEKTSHIYQLMKWSAELWFLRQFDTCHDEEVQCWIKEHTKKIFFKYFRPIVEDDRSGSKDPFSIIAEENACDLLRRLLKLENVKDGFKNILRDWRKIRRLTKDGMSNEMTKIVSEHSDLYYIIPKSTETSKKYAMHFYMRNIFDIDGVPQADLGKFT